MPVPVPIHEGFSAHRAVKSQSTLPDAGVSANPISIFRDSSDYVIHSARQPPTVQTGFTHCTGSLDKRAKWQSSVPFLSGNNSRLLRRPGLCQDGPNLSCGLTAAGDVAISKFAHAEVPRSPVLMPAAVMGLQHFADGRVVDAFGTRCEVDPADLALKSHPQGLNHDHTFLSYSQASFPAWDLSKRPDSIHAEHCYDGLLHPPATPFAEFVDRIVATELTHGHDFDGHDGAPFLPPAVAPSHQHQVASTEPLSDSSYIKVYRAMAEPLSEWMADYIWKVCTDGVNLPRRFVGIGATRTYGDKPSSSLAKSIHSILCSTLLQPSAIVLALWYITRLPVLFDEQTVGVNLTSCELDFRKELYGERLHPSSAERQLVESQAPFRIALLGCMLANKWLDDHTFSNKTWHSISDVPIQSINRLELAALAALGHDLSIAPKAWEMWLAQLRSFPTPICRPSMKDTNTIARKMVADLAVLQERAVPRVSAVTPEQPVFSSFLVTDFNSTGEPGRVGRFDPFEIDLDEDGPLREEYVPKRRSSVKKDGSQCSSIGTSDDSMSPCEPSDWGSRTHWNDTRGMTSHCCPTVPVQDFEASMAPHAHSPWGELQHNSGPLLPCQSDYGNPQFSRDFFGMAFPVINRAICPPAGHTRASSNSSRSSTYNTGHFRSYSQLPISGNDACYALPIPCSRYAGHSTFFHGQVDPCYFQPMWLKT